MNKNWKFEDMLFRAQLKMNKKQKKLLLAELKRRVEVLS